MGIQEWLESLRKWVDGEEDLDSAGEPKPRSKWDDFLISIAREVEQSMRREMFTPPGGPTYVPREYLVFLSTQDDAEWQGEKREGLERGLFHVLSERARELAGENEFQTKTLTVELRVDPSLEPGRFSVQHVWDTAAEKTMVRPRRPATARPEGLLTVAEERDDEATIVRPRKTSEPVFSLAVSRIAPGAETAPPDVRPFFKDEISIGRGSSRISVDLRLEGDLEVSRKHASISRGPDGSFKVTCHGANAILVNDEQEVGMNESAEVSAGDKIAICSYTLIIQ